MSALETLTLSKLMLDGKTKIIGIIGDPIEQVKACLPLTQLMQGRGFNTVLIPLHTKAVDVPAMLDFLLKIENFAGLIVTVPHKQLVASLNVKKTKAAKEAEAVNVIRKIKGEWHADLLDGVGFLAGLISNGFDVKGKAIGIAGAGGAGNAISFALAGAGAADIGICDVDEMKRNTLIARLQSLGYSAHPWDGASAVDLLINATPLGMKPGDPLSISPRAINSGVIVADVIMEPKTTKLLALAQEHGARIMHGHHMMDEQLDQMADFFGAAVQSL